MNDSEKGTEIQELDVSLRVGKGGVESVKHELEEQLTHHDYVKIKILRSARGEHDATTIIQELARAVDGDVVDIRGFTGVITR